MYLFPTFRMEDASKKLKFFGSSFAYNWGYFVPSGSRITPYLALDGRKYGIISVPGRSEYIVFWSNSAANER